MHRAADRLVLLGDPLAVFHDAAGLHRVLHIHRGGVADEADRRMHRSHAENGGKALRLPPGDEGLNAFPGYVGL
ncbi:hypothetical protein SDC9_136166 [bioreactor metagenome]|uniref:Uncharacterized protein n=1 Tax=bioreactor metagenome TaxID=1076179 RepID=A0A645DJ44_9ZZZZ